MTGSGKSELLRTLAIALAVSNRPDELGLILLDYKGGAAFGDCTRLPHTLGVVTDLDAAEAERALRSLRGELRRRERTLREAGARDHAAYRRARDQDPSLRPLPRLLLIVDEFRVLAEDQPEFVSGIVRIASLGRSLGVHLVLATQRPAGVVSAEIRANCGLRIALRVRDRVDSQDVIDADEAAYLPAGHPGRAYFRVGGGDVRPVRVSRVGPRRAPVGAAPIRLRSAQPWADRAEDRARAEQDAARREDSPELDGIVTALTVAARHLRVPPVPPPWLPPLPRRLDRRALTAHLHPQESPRTAAERAGAAQAPGAAIYGLADDPEAAQRVPAVWDPDQGNLAVVGAARSGRSTTVRRCAPDSATTAA